MTRWAPSFNSGLPNSKTRNDEEPDFEQAPRYRPKDQTTVYNPAFSNPVEMQKGLRH